MIKLIIFDLDGVLVDTKDAHFEALNKALNDRGLSKISYQEHISKYDGKSTLTKLSALGLPKDTQKDINEIKQSYTCRILEDLIKKNDKFVDMFKKLKSMGYKICVASNSVRHTIEVCLYKLGVIQFVNYVASNQDVTHGKPHPEMFLKCMLSMGVGPRDTLIVEDSYVGRQAVYNAGAVLCAVTCPEETTLEHIERAIAKNNGVKAKWAGNDMNILIPMAGAGSRFVRSGYTFPKPLIEVRGKPMIQVVVENLNIEGKYIFIVQKDHMDKYNLSHLLNLIAPNCVVIAVEKLTEGAACTTLLAKDYINNDKPLFIANSDQYTEWDSSHFMYSMQGHHIDGGIPCFYNTHPKWSYAKSDENGYITEVREKVPISTDATVGTYFWSKGSDYVKYAEQMIKKDIRVNGEFYVAPVYNEAIEDGKKIKIYNVEKMWGLGTPEDLDYFIKNKEL